MIIVHDLIKTAFNKISYDDYKIILFPDAPFFSNSKYDDEIIRLNGKNNLEKLIISKGIYRLSINKKHFYHFDIHSALNTHYSIITESILRLKDSTILIDGYDLLKSEYKNKIYQSAYDNNCTMIFGISESFSLSIDIPHIRDDDEYFSALLKYSILCANKKYFKNIKSISTSAKDHLFGYEFKDKTKISNLSELMAVINATVADMPHNAYKIKSEDLVFIKFNNSFIYKYMDVFIDYFKNADTKEKDILKEFTRYDILNKFNKIRDMDTNRILDAKKKIKAIENLPLKKIDIIRSRIKAKSRSVKRKHMDLIDILKAEQCDYDKIIMDGLNFLEKKEKPSESFMQAVDKFNNIYSSEKFKKKQSLKRISDLEFIDGLLGNGKPKRSF